MKSNVVTKDWLLRAMNAGEFRAYIQPIVRASDLSVSGGELLVRWHTPERKVIPPARFISQTESFGLLPGMTCRLMLQAANEFLGLGNALPDSFRLAVNVTPALLSDKQFIQMCLILAGEGKIRLVLELTEQQPFYIDWQTEWILSLLNNAGVEFSLDDFGTGCSALSYLKYFPVSYIKIDKVFTQDILCEDSCSSQYIVESVIGLAEKLGINTVAEGVETRIQADYLSALGVNYLQGFYYGRPEEVSVFCCKYLQRQSCGQKRENGFNIIK
ncbi:EAL domain-containing protein [Escherichia coli]|uniref:EAL domain-containing protein n=1 Tax=Escherichia coli TaxID=562 RepID=UPI00164F5552|nr:EAL domain-containing protein [Escherichia coli]EFB1556605.1 EAL domain-containing protein [Escherichia coli]EFC0661205.1 EAL domain-containing protein [Escherichia coli]EFC0690920.1 EAL domain-containing protein [Escherichia coli]EFC1627686.1 EAL domain-containing protein [Escherichia coli]EFC1632322.1 EAL domain-containing protein [Escherichia coli]